MGAGGRGCGASGSSSPGSSGTGASGSMFGSGSGNDAPMGRVNQQDAPTGQYGEHTECHQGSVTGRFWRLEAGPRLAGWGGPGVGGFVAAAAGGAAASAGGGAWGGVGAGGGGAW